MGLLAKLGQGKMEKKFTNQRGVTLVELLLVMGIIATLFGITTINLLNARVGVSNSASTSVLISDIKSQQVKSMNGDTEGRGIPDSYGVNIQSNRYVLFHGISYLASDTANFNVPNDSGYTLTSTFPNNTIVFASMSGEIVGFVNGANSITTTNDSTGRSKTIQINKYGVITNVN